MTVLTSETSVLMTGARLPRVNLLPPEIAEEKRLRKVQLALGAAGLGAVAVVGVLYLSANHSVSSAQGALDQANSAQASRQAQIAKYADVTATKAASEAAQAQLTLAMGDEVRYSSLLTDLSLSVPGNVWLKNLSFTPKTTSSTPGAASAVAGPVTVGTLNVSGVAYSHDDVALWLEALAGLKTYANPYFTNSTEALIGTRKTVNFSSTADLTVKALSGRYLTPRS